MLVSKRSIGGTKKGGPFVQGRRMTPPANSRSITQWVLRNNKVEFTFSSSPICGVFLDSWKLRNSSITYTNKSRALWSLNIRRTTKVNEHTGEQWYDRYEVYPTKKYLVYPSTTPVVSFGVQSLEFSWLDMHYDTRNPKNTLNLVLTISLGPQDDFVDMSLSLRANQAYPINKTAEDNTSVTISSVNTPSFIIRKSSSETENKNRILSLPLLEGYTYRDPNKYLRAPRFPSESFQYNYTATRAYMPTNVADASPYSSKNNTRANFGSPGLMSMPLLIWGNRQDKEGFMVYAMDPDGLHAKGWQWYADDNNVHLKSYDVCDYEIDPNGVGGKI